MSVSFDTHNTDKAIAKKIAMRAAALETQHNGTARALSDWWMDIVATHANGNPLRLADLLAADDFNFAHDVFGIARHLDRSTGQLGDHFSPRFSTRIASMGAA